MREEKFLSGLDADRVLSESIPLWVKLIFLATNLPYWLIVIFAGYDWLQLEGTANVCGHPALYFVMGTLVALSSTVMHSSQLRLGQLVCCSHHARAEVFHETESQKMFKKVDIFCALSALCASISCHSWNDLAFTLAIAFPLFVSGVFLKRLSYHYLYLITHGSWHIVTSMLVWNSILRRY